MSGNLQRVDGALQPGPTRTTSSLRTLPLPRLVTEALQAHRERRAQERVAAGERWTGSGLAFTGRVGTAIEPDNLRRSWYPLRDRPGLTLRLHDLRRTCVTLLPDLGVPPHIVRQIAGHSDIGATMKVHAHASLDEQRKALGALSDRLA